MFSDITWGMPGFLWIIPVVGLLLLVAVYQQVQAARLLDQLASPLHVHRLFKHFSLFGQRAMFACYLIALIVFCGASLGPQWGAREEVVPQEGRNIMIALDISRSMLAADFKPSRLEHAKMKIQQLLAMLPAERVGLMLFSGDAFVQCPLTRDYGAFSLFLRTVTPEMFGTGTTNIDQAISRAISAFEQHQDTSSKLLVLITDGEDFAPAQQGLKEKAQHAGLRLLALGVGTLDGAPIPQYDVHGKNTGYLLDAQGKVVLSQLNEAYLQQKVTDFGGRYAASTYDDRDIRALSDYILAQEKQQHEERSMTIHEAQYPWFVALAGFFWGIAWLF